MIDPKPKVSKAAILSNIEYYKALGNKASVAYREALLEETYWIIKLRELENELKRKD